jgi:plasmid stabilization system protein ParE
MYSIDWTLRAELTCYKEIDFIESKWSLKEVEKFIDLVEDKIQNLSTGILTGKPGNIAGVNILVLSKQTSLAYKVFEEVSRIELLTFWSNKVDPEEYQSFIEI